MQALGPRLFDDSDTDPIDPFEMFEEWYAEARGREPNDANAMVLATVDPSGMPDARIVWMSRRSAEGIVFYSSSESMKGAQLAENARAALVFHWKSRFRQVRLRGVIEQVDVEDADAHFRTRPHGAKISAHASQQSRPLENRRELMRRVEKLEAKYGNGDIPRPADWTGYRLKPIVWEFWQSGEIRLHDRIRFTRTGEAWTRQRLNP